MWSPRAAPRAAPRLAMIPRHFSIQAVPAGHAVILDQERARQEERGRQGEGMRLPPAHDRHDTAHDRHHPCASEGAHADREQGIPGEADQGVGEQTP